MVVFVVVCRQNSDWWLAQHLVTSEEGLVPSNYVVEDSSAPEAQESVSLFVSLSLSVQVYALQCNLLSSFN